MDQNVGQIERPIETIEQDRLERSGFVSRLVDALAPPATGRASGIVIGITGSWGSGKSSVLNLIEHELKQRQPGSIVVRFDPWLVSGRDDLIGAFLQELSQAFKVKRSTSDGVTEAIKTIDAYAGHLAPIINLIVPNLGTIMKGGAAGAARLTRKEGSLHKTREDVLAAMAKVTVPVVVLIDELDRVEDSEVRTMAQLVRSVADFPNISYALAYDAQRVAEALGSSPTDADGRGRAYLEKIVQLPIALPILLPEELSRLANAELDRVHRSLGVADSLLRPGEHKRVIEAIIPQLVSTPRDVKRMIGTYQALSGMLCGEVDLADVLGFSALTVKAPRTVDLLRQNPEAYVVDPLSFAENVRRAQQPPSSPEVIAKQEEAAHTLMLRLFPALGGQVSIEDLYSDSIGMRRSLIIALRLGVPQGEVTRETAEALLGMPADAVKYELSQALATDTLGPLIDRLDSIYGSHSGNDLPFWIGASQFLDDPNPSPEIQFGIKRDAAEALNSVLINAVRRRPDLRNKALHIFQSLRRENDYSLTPRWLHRHIFTHGVLGARHDGGGGWFISSSAIVSEVQNAVNDWSSDLLREKLLPRLMDAYPLLLSHRVQWGTSEKVSLVQSASGEVDRLVRVFFGGARVTDPKIIDDLFGWAKFKEMISHRRQEAGVPSDVLAAIEKIEDIGADYVPQQPHGLFQGRTAGSPQI